MAASGDNRFEILCATSQPPDAQASLRHTPFIFCAKPSMITSGNRQVSDAAIQPMAKGPAGNVGSTSSCRSSFRMKSKQL